MQSRALVGVLAVVALACGDPDTNDERGYTKAPLETPGLLVKGEDPSPMSRLGQPDRPRPSLEAVDRETETEAGAGAAEQAEVSLAPGVTQEQYEQGQQVYAGPGGCQACHGPGGSGSMLGPDLTDDEWLHISGPDVEELAAVIRSGVAQPQEYPGPMPPMGGASLDEEQLQAVAAYVASLARS